MKWHSGKAEGLEIITLGSASGSSFVMTCGGNWLIKPQKRKPPLDAFTQGERYVLRLYVAGPTSRSSRAVMNAEQICERHYTEKSLGITGYTQED